MSKQNTTSLQRVLTTLGHNEPDRVPLFLLVSMHGAKELGLSIKEYFSRAEYVAEGQLRLREKYHHDCLYNLFYAPVEVEAFGGEVIFADDGPANSGRPIITRPDDILSLKVPIIKETACLMKVLDATRMLKEKAADDAPILGVVLSPFSLPVMQMGFDKYLDLMYGNPELFNRLMEINEAFCVEWANAQLEAGATAITYFDPLSSPTITTRDMFLKNALPIAKKTISQIKGPNGIHLASGRSLSVIDDICEIGTGIIGVSVMEDLAEVKKACRGRIAVLGNLNGIEMRRWTPQQAEAIVKDAIAKAGPGGGYILSDNHGEIPFPVPDEILHAISDAVHKWGRYPLDWVESYNNEK